MPSGPPGVFGRQATYNLASLSQTMAKHLDLEEQEQLDAIKHFWNQYGNAITWVLVAVMAAVAGWNGWQYWQRQQASQASVLFDEVERSLQSGDVTKVERSVTDIRNKFGATAFAQQAQLLGARFLNDNGKTDAAKEALRWVAEQGKDEGYRAVARLRLSALLLDAKQFDAALAQLAATFPPSFAGLAADRRGDVLLAQGKNAEAQAAYVSAYASLDTRSEYRRMVEVKLNALGVDPTVSKTVPNEVKP